MKARILVVEDEPAISDNIQFVLESEGLETVRVATGLAAIPVLDESQIDLIVLDIGLPDINGLELLKDIRRTRATPSPGKPSSVAVRRVTSISRYGVAGPRSLMRTTT